MRRVESRRSHALTPCFSGLGKAKQGHGFAVQGRLILLEGENGVGFLLFKSYLADFILASYCTNGDNGSFHAEHAENIWYNEDTFSIFVKSRLRKHNAYDCCKRMNHVQSGLSRGGNK